MISENVLPARTGAEPCSVTVFFPSVIKISKLPSLE